MRTRLTNAWRPIREKVLARLRILCRRTPPQRENGWTNAADALPSRDGPNGRWQKVEAYNRASDSLLVTYVWSLEEMTPEDRKGYFWREYDPAIDKSDRHFEYFKRSQTVLG